MLSIYARAIARAPGRRQGVLPEALGRRVPAIAVLQQGAIVDPARVALFRSVCGHGTSADDPVPAAFLETLFIGLMAEGVLSRDFPFSPFGLIHVRQVMREREPVRAGARLDLSCRMAAVTGTDRGWEIDFAMEARACGAGGDPLWEGTATLLSRNASTRSRTGSSPRPAGGPWRGASWPGPHRSRPRSRGRSSCQAGWGSRSRRPGGVRSGSGCPIRGTARPTSWGGCHPGHSRDDGSGVTRVE